MRRPTTLRAAVIVAVLALIGCQDPYTRDQNRPATHQSHRPVATPTDPSQPRPPPSSPTGAHAPALRSARRAAETFATRWVNWDWRTAARQQRALARVSTSELAQRLRANAASARIDATLARDKPGSRGTIAATAINAASGRAAGIVVTHEQTLTYGRSELGGQRYRVYLIRLARNKQRWEVSAWSPQP